MVFGGRKCRRTTMVARPPRTIESEHFFKSDIIDVIDYLLYEFLPVTFLLHVFDIFVFLL